MKTLMTLSLAVALSAGATAKFADKCYRINYNVITQKAKVTEIPCPKD
ncbi:hypothetical protein GCM10027190_59240 [Spirosoma areae]